MDAGTEKRQAIEDGNTEQTRLETVMDAAINDRNTYAKNELDLTSAVNAVRDAVEVLKSSKRPAGQPDGQAFLETPRTRAVLPALKKAILLADGLGIKVPRTKALRALLQAKGDGEWSE